MRSLRSFLKLSKKFADEFFVIILFPSAFLDLALLSTHTNKTHISLYSFILIILLNSYLLLLTYHLVKISNIKKVKLINPVIIPISLFTIIRLSFLDSIPRWDGSEYFQALLRGINHFDFSFSSLIYDFNWFNHTTMGYGVATSIFQLINPTNLIMLNITSLLLGVLGIYSFYKICNYYFGKENKIENTLITTLFAINPLFVGVSTAFTPDFGVLIFFLAFLSTFLYNKPVLSFFFGTLLVFTKETGAFVYGIFVLFNITPKQIINWKKISQEKITRLLFLISPLLLLVLYFLYTKWTFWSPDGNNFYTLGNDCRFCFGIKPHNMFEYIKVFFVLNFNWIFSLISVIGLSKILINKIKLNNVSKEILETVIPVFLGFVSLFMVFVVYVMPRYVVFSNALLILLFSFAIKHVLTNRLKRIVFLLILVPVFLIETFLTVDPISITAFGTYKLGDHRLLKVGTEYLGDAFIYNTQYTNVDRLLSKFISEYNITENDNIFIEPYSWGNFYPGWGQFSGQQPKIFFSLNNPNQFPDHIYYVSFPFRRYTSDETRKLQDSYTAPLENPETILTELKKIYIINNSRKIEVNGYWVMVYKLSKK